MNNYFHHQLMVLSNFTKKNVSKFSDFIFINNI